MNDFLLLLWLADARGTLNGLTALLIIALIAYLIGTSVLTKKCDLPRVNLTFREFIL